MRKRIVAGLLASLMALSMVACGGNKETGGANDTLVIGQDAWSGVFSPFFYSLNADAAVFERVVETVLQSDYQNNLIDNLGHIEEEVVGEGDNQKTVYTITLQDGVKFTDGEPLTIDDLIFSYKVLLDPNYDGIATFRTASHIVGSDEYYYDDPNYSSKLEEIKKKAEAKGKTEEGFLKYLVDSKCNGMFVEVGEDPDGEDGPLTSWADYLKEKGHSISEADAKDEGKLLAALAKCEYDTNKESYDAVSYYEETLTKEMVQNGLSDGVDVPEIAGIERVDDLTCKVTTEGVDINVKRQLGGVPVAPEHYYGVGFEKGKLDGVKAKNGEPMGTGTYIFVKNKDNVVSMDANEGYRRGAPKIKHLAFQVVESNQKIDAVLNGEVDIVDPSASQEAIAKLDENQANYDLYDNNGYGYIAISAKRIPDINVREGLMHLMTREQAISTYFGPLAQVIERPMTTVLAESPKDAKEYWGYDPDKALECFKKAGYIQKDGKLVKNGKQLIVEAAISDASSHPSTPIFTQMKNDMEAMGAKLNITDCKGSLLFDRVDNDDLDMWCAAWGNSTHCDLSQMFGSTYTKKGGSNRTWIQDKELDKLLAQTMKTFDLEERKALVAKELDLIMSHATYMPVYQRKNMYVYSSNINMDTLPKERSMFYNHLNELEKLELN